MDERASSIQFAYHVSPIVPCLSYEVLVQQPYAHVLRHHHSLIDVVEVRRVPHSDMRQAAIAFLGDLEPMGALPYSGQAY